MTDRELLQQALDALEDVLDDAEEPHKTKDAIEAIRTRLTQLEPEPVAWLGISETWGLPKMVVSEYKKEGYKPVYLSPPKKEWVGLTDEDIENATDNVGGYKDFARAIDAKLKEKNT